VTTPAAPRTTPVLAYPLGDALYLNVTSGCTLACVFCPKIREGDFSLAGFDLRLATDPSVEELWHAAAAAGIAGRSEVVFTGFGEPTRRLGAVVELVRRLKAAGVARVRVDTDGLADLREGRDAAADLADAGLDAICVSLNAPDAATYARICPSRHGEAAYAAVVGFIRGAIGRVPEVSASFVALPSLSEAVCRGVADELGARFRWRPHDRLGRLEPASPLPGPG